jgi:hypothetical protein
MKPGSGSSSTAVALAPTGKVDSRTARFWRSLAQSPPVRFKAGTPLEFTVRVLLPANGTIAVWPAPQLVQRVNEETQVAGRIALVFKDPTNYDLLKLDTNAKTGNRELILTRRGFINSTGSLGIFVLLRQWGQDSFHLRPAEPMAPGEYAFKYGLTQDDCRELHAFGIDP